MSTVADESVGEYFNHDDQHINTMVLRTFDDDGRYVLTRFSETKVKFSPLSFVQFFMDTSLLFGIRIIRSRIIHYV